MDKELTLLITVTKDQVMNFDYNRKPQIKLLICEAEAGVLFERT